MTRLRGLPLALTVAAVVILVDRVTKVWAERRLVSGPCTPGGNECIDVVLSLRFHLVYNYGAAFSTGVGFGPVFGVLAAIMSIVLFRLAHRSASRLQSLLFGLIAGGAIGNLIDRLIRAEDGFLSGGVIDFIDLQWWPVFNVADMAVVSGVVAFIAYSLIVGEPDEREPASEPEASQPEASEREASEREASEREASEPEGEGGHTDTDGVERAGHGPGAAGGEGAADGDLNQAGTNGARS